MIIGAGLAIFILTASVLACILSTLSVILGASAIITVKAMEKSTHSVQMVTPEQAGIFEEQAKDVDGFNKEMKEDNEYEFITSI